MISSLSCYFWGVGMPVVTESSMSFFINYESPVIDISAKAVFFSFSNSPLVVIWNSRDSTDSYHCILKDVSLCLFVFISLTTDHQTPLKSHKCFKVSYISVLCYSLLLSSPGWSSFRMTDLFQNISKRTHFII